MDYGNSKQAYERLLSKMLADMPRKENKAALAQHVSWLKAKGSNPRTVLKHLYHFQRFVNALDKKVVFDKITRTQVESAMAKIEESDYAIETKNQIKVVVKTFYKHRLGDDIYYPPQVAWIKLSNKTRKILPEDILSEDEVLRMIEAAKSDRDKAIIALLYDSGARIGELLSLRVKDVNLGGKLAHVMMNGKTGMRQVPIIFSEPYLARYANSLGNPDPAEPFWRTRNESGKRYLEYAALRKMLGDVTKRAKLRKRIYPHLFRHSRASNYANKLTEQQLKSLFGWSGSSRMAGTYVHLSGRDIDDAVLKANGLVVEKENTKPKLTVKICPKCHFSNTIHSTYCNNCGGILDINTAVREEEQNTIVKEAALEALKDPKVLDKLIDLIQKDQEKKRKK